MTTKDQVIDLHARHPDWTAGKIASELGCDPAYVRGTAHRMKLKIPPRRPKIDHSALELGLACRAAGLTLRDILDISERKRSQSQ